MKVKPRRRGGRKEKCSSQRKNFVEDQEKVVTGRVGRNRNRTWRSHSRRLLVLTWHLLSFCVSLPVPLPCPLLGPPLFLFLSLMSGMLRPRHALIGDGLRRPTTAAYARTQLGKCGGEGRGSWVVPEYTEFLARCRVVALLQATVIRAVLPPTSTTTTTHGWILPLPTFLFQLACARDSYFGCLLKLELLLPSSRLPALLPSLRLISLINFPLLDFAKNRRLKIHLGIRTVSYSFTFHL